MLTRQRLTYIAIFIGSYIVFYFMFYMTEAVKSKIYIFFFASLSTFLFWGNAYVNKKSLQKEKEKEKQRRDKQKQSEENESKRHYGDFSNHSGWGYYLIEYKPGLWRDNTATVGNIVKSLGSNHPLSHGGNLKIPDKNEDQESYNKRLDEIIQKHHFDGHLYIGGNLYWDGQGHILTVGGTRSGKTSCLAVPALASFTNMLPGAPSYICLDPKGELAAITGSYLKKIGYNVVCINPFRIPEIAKFGNHGFNVFETFTGDDPEFDKYSDMIVNAIIPPRPHANDFWDKASRSMIGLYIRHMMTQDEEPKNFTTLWRWLRYAGDQRSTLIENMGFSDAFDGDVSSEAMAIAGQIAQGGGKEIESVFATIRANTDIFKDQQLRNSITQSDFDITTIAKQKTVVFVCMAPDDLERCLAWLRILFGSLMRTLTRHYSKTRKTIMIMDEFVQMGALKEFEVFSAYAAGIGAGVTLWPIIQDLGQLKSLYPGSWEGFIGNAMIRHFIKVGDNFTADYVSKRMPIVDKGTDEKPNREPFLRPDQIVNYDDNDMIVLINGVSKPALFRRKGYWDIPLIKDEVEQNPFRKSTAQSPDHGFGSSAPA